MNIDRLRDIREDRDLKQRDIAKILHVTQAQYCRYEMGVNMIPIEKLIILANYYNTSVDYLVGVTDKIEPYPKSLFVQNRQNKIHYEIKTLVP